MGTSDAGLLKNVKTLPLFLSWSLIPHGVIPCLSMSLPLVMSAHSYLLFSCDLLFSLTQLSPHPCKLGKCYLPQHYSGFLGAQLETATLFRSPAEGSTTPGGPSSWDRIFSKSLFPLKSTQSSSMSSQLKGTVS